MLYALSAALVVVWLLNLAGTHTAGTAVHILLGVATVAVLLRTITSGGSVP